MQKCVFSTTRKRMMTVALVQLILVIALSATVDASEVTQLTVIASQSVTINCYDFTASTAPRRVEWFSLAWSGNYDPLYIFRSEGNSDFAVEASHPNAENYVVDGQYKLTITNINRLQDPGKYVCRVVTDSGEERDHEYQLNVGEKPSCEASQTTAEPGSQLALTCKMLFSGNSPTMAWYAGEDQRLDSVDKFEPASAQIDVTRSVTMDDDRRPFRCNTSLGAMEQVCQVIVQVPHAVREARLTPDKTSLHVGDELKCSARGNPSPVLTFSPATATETSGQEDGLVWKTMIVPQEWKGKHYTVSCTAVNVFQRRTHQLVANATFDVMGALPVHGKNTGAVQSSAWCSGILLLLASILLSLVTV